MKKIISLFLALILVCCTVSMAAAVSEVLKEGTGDVGFPELGFRFSPPVIPKRDWKSSVFLTA